MKKIHLKIKNKIDCLILILNLNQDFLKIYRVHNNYPIVLSNHILENLMIFRVDPTKILKFYQNISHQLPHWIIKLQI